MNRHPILVAALLLALFGVLGTSLVAFTHEQTKERIAANERQALLDSLHQLVPAAEVDNDMATDLISVRDPNSTTPQNAEMTPSAGESPPGITTLDGRSSSNHGAGSSQRSFADGPVGPLNAPF